MTTKHKPKKTKTSRAAQTRAIALDRAKRPASMPSPEQIEQSLADLVKPVVLNLQQHYYAAGLRVRILTLPVMVCFVLSLIWRQLASVNTALRELCQFGLLWQPPLKVSQQAVSQRLRELPAQLFAQLLAQLLPLFQSRWYSRTTPRPAWQAKLLANFSQVVAVDASTLDALVKKVGLLRTPDPSPTATDTKPSPTPTVLGGRMLALLDVLSQLPVQIWYGEDSLAHEQNWWATIMAELKPKSLVLFDLGFLNYGRYAELSKAGQSFISRAKITMAYRLERVLASGEGWQDSLIKIKVEQVGELSLRLIEINHKGQKQRYVSNVLEPALLSAAEIAYLYGQRWQIETAFKNVKRLLGLAYFHVGSQNGIRLQVWATWLLYGVLVDLSDEIAQELGVTFERISIEMVYRSIGYYSRAKAQGETGSLVSYLAQNAKLLGLVKRVKKSTL